MTYECTQFKQKSNWMVSLVQICVQKRFEILLCHNDEFMQQFYGCYISFPLNEETSIIVHEFKILPNQRNS